MLTSDAERRKIQIYEVTLPAVHHLCETLGGVPPKEELLQNYDAPVLVSDVWALELDPPLRMYEG